MTPGRLAMHEDALVGIELRAAHVYGGFDSKGSFQIATPGSSEQDVEQRLIGAWRIPAVDRMQLALLVPWLETRRAVRGVSEVGTGLGDVNVGARYDVLNLDEKVHVPGIALLAGVTLPTGRAPEASARPLASDATGIGALQATVGLAAETSAGAWSFTLTGLVAKRAPRHVAGIRTVLAAQGSVLLAAAYTFASERILFASASYAWEGDADVEGQRVPWSARRIPVVGLGALAPLSRHVRIQGSLSVTPPFALLGSNQPASLALAATALYAWY